METGKYDDHYLKYKTRTLLLLNPEPEKEKAPPRRYTSTSDYPYSLNIQLTKLTDEHLLYRCQK